MEPLYKLQVKANTHMWWTTLMQGSKAACEKDRKQRTKHAMITLPMRIVPASDADSL